MNHPVRFLFSMISVVRKIDWVIMSNCAAAIRWNWSAIQSVVFVTSRGRIVATDWSGLNPAWFYVSFQMRCLCGLVFWANIFSTHPVSCFCFSTISTFDSKQMINLTSFVELPFFRCTYSLFPRLQFGFCGWKILFCLHLTFTSERGNNILCSNGTASPNQRLHPNSYIGQ